jgi:hypothetical protein
VSRSGGNVPSKGDFLMVRAATSKTWWFRMQVSEDVVGDHVVLGSGMGTRVVRLSALGKDWRWPKDGEGQVSLSGEGQ